MNKRIREIPTFASEAQERAYWEAHDSSDHLDGSKAVKVTLPNLKPTTKTISLRLPQHLLDSIKVAANCRKSSTPPEWRARRCARLDAGHDGC